MLRYCVMRGFGSLGTMCDCLPASCPLLGLLDKFFNLRNPKSAANPMHNQVDTAALGSKLSSDSETGSTALGTLPKQGKSSKKKANLVGSLLRAVKLSLRWVRQQLLKLLGFKATRQEL
mmetsp:Transcript_47365/g.74028  ORF Transcript_47365/g.74028 Transcript_47365/m.74028 type:complete len:119 (+) Transcript_47365:2199-2555(+)